MLLACEGRGVPRPLKEMAAAVYTHKQGVQHAQGDGGGGGGTRERAAHGLCATREMPDVRLTEESISDSLKRHMSGANHTLAPSSNRASRARKAQVRSASPRATRIREPDSVSRVGG